MEIGIDATIARLKKELANTPGGYRWRSKRSRLENDIYVLAKLKREIEEEDRRKAIKH